MTTLNLTTVPAVAVGTSSITQTAYTPTISTYGTFYEVGRLTWTEVSNDIVGCTGYVTLTVSAITASGTDRLAVFVRGRLTDMTTGYDVWAGTTNQLAYYRIGAVDYAPLSRIISVNERFSTLLVAGHAYQWHVEVMKQQTVGTPVATVTINDSSCFSDAATRNF
jgi:hypothetical protein